MEEEGKTLEDALDVEGNESGESLDEVEDGLLEHAMNSGLLNDDDREHFRTSIARIQLNRLVLVE